jgi:hypothetical protein
MIMDIREADDCTSNIWGGFAEMVAFFSVADRRCCGALTKLVVRIACGMNVLMRLLCLNCWSAPFAERKEHAHCMSMYSSLFLRFSYGAAVNFFLVVCRRDCRA